MYWLDLTAEDGSDLRRTMQASGRPGETEAAGSRAGDTWLSPGRGPEPYNGR